MTTTPLVTVLPHAKVPGWPKYSNAPRCRVLPLLTPDDDDDAIYTAFNTDAHFVAYTSPRNQRLNSEALGRVPVVMTCVVLDVDCPLVHGTPEPAPESWRIELRERVVALAEVHPDPIYYETRGGARVVYQLPEPVELRSPDDAGRWKRSYALLIAYMATRFSIVCDSACGDWQRLFRLPMATRTPGGKPENYPVGHSWGAPIGTLQFTATRDELGAATQRCKAFGQGKSQAYTAFNGTGDGRLFELVKARGDVIGTHVKGWLIRCPNEREHTSGSTGDGSTLLYPPAAGKPLGAVHCLHAHCQGLTQRDWVQRLEREAGLQAGQPVR